MKRIELAGLWQMCAADEDAWLDAQVPGSVAATLIANGIMPDPYFRDNEEKVQHFFEKDYIFKRSFHADDETLSQDMVRLVCEGLDTLAIICINGKELVRTNNMHRIWEFDVKEFIKQGENRITIRFASPTEYLRKNPSKTGRKFSVIRKAACMFGWDWGLCLPDSGIWRDIYIKAFSYAQISHIQINQRHSENKVTLEAQIHAKIWGEGVTVNVSLISPSGETLFDETEHAKDKTDFTVVIGNPALWQPAGYGEQPLYELTVTLEKNGEILETYERQIGLRTIVLNRGKKPGGSNFGFIVNGRPIFYKGENLVIEDSIISRTSNERWDRLISNCLRSNVNGIRVWGGAYYPPGYFYRQCDKHGLLVWQDFMFACTFYMTDDAFLENVRHELADNLKRISHHACLALLCGNNEAESIYTVMGSKEPQTVALRKLFGSDKRAGFILRLIVRRIYKKLFLDLIPSICRQYAPQTSYVHSSPSTRKPLSAKSFLDYLSDGDMHYYLQYNGNAPYQKIRTVRCRFMTEMGFQSYPSAKTIAAFTSEDDRSPYSPVMYAHQKCKNGNEAIELYMARDYGVPKDFEDYVYLSQLQAGEIMRYAVEHLRRDYGYCNGMVIWQLNDCWPVVSWSGIDYYGRWKAQQYFTKRFYEPVLLSALDDGNRAGLWLTNNSPRSESCTIVSVLRRADGAVLHRESLAVTAPPGTSREYMALDFTEHIKEHGNNRVYLSFHLECGGKIWGKNTMLFCLPKEFGFENPRIAVDVTEEETRFAVTVSADCYVKGLALDTREGDCIFTDNYFDLPHDTCVTVYADKADLQGLSVLSANNLTTACLNTAILKIQEDGSKAI